jgi:hypothetical protein
MRDAVANTSKTYFRPRHVKLQRNGSWTKSNSKLSQPLSKK